MAKVILSCLLLTLLLGSSGKHDTGHIRGSVQNSDTRELLPMSSIGFISIGDSVPYRQILSRSGKFMMMGIPKGLYRARVSRAGFIPFLTPQFEVKADSVVGLTFVLRPISERYDTTDAIRIGKPGVDYKMNYFRPEAGKYK